MTKKIVLLILSIITLTFCDAQKHKAPYEWDWAKDGVYTSAALLGSSGGFMLIIISVRLKYRFSQK